MTSISSFIVQSDQENTERMTTQVWMRIALFSTILQTVLTLGCGAGINDSLPFNNPQTTASLTTTQNPLVAKYAVTPSHLAAIAWVEFGTDTTYGRQTSTTVATTNYGEKLTILVAGMRANTTYHIRGHDRMSDLVDTVAGILILPCRSFLFQSSVGFRRSERCSVPHDWQSAGELSLGRPEFTGHLFDRT